MYSNYDREGDSESTASYSETSTYAVAFGDEPGEWIPKAGMKAKAGMGQATAEYSFLKAKAKGPNAKAKAEIDAVDGVEAMVDAEIVSASASAGPLKVKAGLGFKTGIKAGPTGVEAKFLGTGIMIGEETGVSILGSEVKCCIQ